MLQKFIDYLLIEKKYASHTVKAYQNDINHFFDFSFKGGDGVDEKNVDIKMVRSWVVALSNEQYAPKSINRKTTALRSYYKFLQKTGCVTVNPLSQLKSLKVKKEVLVPFNELEIGSALESKIEGVNEFEIVRNKLIISLLYTTGIRRDELIHLKCSDVSLDQLEIKVLGKRNKERIIPLLNSMIFELQDYLTVRNQLGLDNDYFFVTKSDNKMYPSLVYRIVNSYFSNVTTKVKKSPHVLRHSYATDLINNGADLNSVKELLGHTSLAATQIYMHNSLDKIKQVYNQAHPRGATKTRKT